jgi:TatD family-associated radical SAM protein
MTIAYEYRPGRLYLNVTNRCSNDCVFCVRQGPGYSLGGMDMRLAREPTADEVKGAIRAAEQERRQGRVFDEVVFCGFGEPTHRLGLIGEVGQWLRGRGVAVRLNTNGHAALLNGQDLGAIVELLTEAVDTVSISLNAPSAEEYEELCEPSFGKEAFEAMVGFARACVGRVGCVVLTVVGFCLEEEAIDRCEELADAIGAEFRVR